MAISSRAEYRYDKQVKNNEYQNEKFSMMKEKYYRVALNGLIGYLLFAFLFTSCWSCSWVVRSKDEFEITDLGIKDLIEIGMTIGEFSEKGVPFGLKPSEFKKPNEILYKSDQLGIEFETLDDIIIRIWFFADRNDALMVWLPKNNERRNIKSITPNDIVRNFGEVKKYVEQYPPKERHEATWAKYHAFGMAYNTIYYPDASYNFGLNWDDTISYITISKR